MPSRRPQGDPTVAPEDAAEATADAEPETTTKKKAGAEVCVNCGLPATYKTTSEAVNEVFFCDDHAQQAGGGIAPL